MLFTLCSPMYQLFALWFPVNNDNSVYSVFQNKFDITLHAFNFLNLTTTNTLYFTLPILYFKASDNIKLKLLLIHLIQNIAIELC